MKKVSISNLAEVSKKILIAMSVPKDDAQIIADSIVYAHRRGKGTHGIGRLPIYVKKIQSDLLNPATKFDLIKESPTISIFDAGHGFGQVAAIRGMNCAIEKAKQLGVGIVSIRNSNNFGTAGFISEMASNSGMIGIVLSNSAPAIAATGGNKPILGTNPIAIAFPGTEGRFPISIDMAMSEVARGKIRLAQKEGATIPIGWALSKLGIPTTDPDEALNGSMIPIGGAKGYGLALAVDILAGLLSGSSFGGDTLPLASEKDYSRYGHFILAINIGFFMPLEEYCHKFNYLVESIKHSGTDGSVFTPGERSIKLEKESVDFVTITQKQMEEINALGKSLNLSRFNLVEHET